MKKYRIAIDVGGTKFLYGLFDQENHILGRKKTKTPQGITNEDMSRKFYEEITAFVKEYQITMEEIQGIGVGLPGYVDYAGTLISGGSLENVKCYPAGEELKKLFPGLKIVVDNDTNLAALAEQRYGAGKGCRNLCYTALSTGIGSGFIINNELFRGDYGGAGESGHMLVTPGQGELCGCENRGCIMSYASGIMIANHIRTAIRKGRQTVMTHMVKDMADISAVQLHQAYLIGDPLAVEMYQQMIHYIGIYIYNIFTSFNFSTFVCGGGLTAMGEDFLKDISREANQYNHHKNQKMDIRYAELGSDMGIIGAAIVLE
ncbi:MAG: ROK family protein [Lachnospiraceae bacterium]|nr:ROK family protein [Lachnospiraceae bacterium]